MTKDEAATSLSKYLSYHPLKCFSYVSILIELSHRKLSGYDLLLHTRKFGFHVSPGTLYHQLHLLSKDGMITGSKQDRKTMYEMTEKGQEAFEEFKHKTKDALEYVYQNLTLQT